MLESFKWLFLLLFYEAIHFHGIMIVAYNFPFPFKKESLREVWIFSSSLLHIIFTIKKNIHVLCRLASHSCRYTRFRRQNHFHLCYENFPIPMIPPKDIRSKKTVLNWTRCSISDSNTMWVDFIVRVTTFNFDIILYNQEYLLPYINCHHQMQYVLIFYRRLLFMTLCTGSIRS